MTFVAKKIAAADVYSENFNHYFTEKLNSLTEEQKHRLPNDIIFKVFKYGTAATAEQLNFVEKMWMLETVFNCSINIIVEDIEAGLDIAHFKDALKAQRGRIENTQLLDELKIRAAFFLGGKELMASILYLENLCNSGIYRLSKSHIPNADHKKNKKYIRQKDDFNQTLSFLCNYEATKKRITMLYDLNIPELYALLYFGSGEKYGGDFTRGDFSHAYNSNQTELFKGMTRMHRLGYILQRKTGLKHKYVISSKGLDLLNRIFSNILNKI